jgi:hypothetical protein
MMGGNVLQYVKDTKPNVDIIALVGIFSILSTAASFYAHKLLDIIRGVCYLHGEGFVHGDLRAVRVFSSMTTIYTDLKSQMFSWMIKDLPALRTSALFLSSKHLTSQQLAVAILNGWRPSSIRIWCSNALKLPISTLLVAYASRYDSYEYLSYILSPLITIS